MTILTILCLLLIAPGTQPQNPPLRVMTFNLRYASDQKPNAWQDRRPVMKELLLNNAPDLLGTQEGLKDQLQDINADLGNAYARFGGGRLGKDRDEHMAVFYRKDRLTLLEHGDFWLSDTPEIPGSKSWGNTLPRMVTFARFEDQRTGVRFMFFNTHFDHASENSRQKSAAMLRDRINAIAPAESPAIITGDFNAPHEQSETWRILLSADGLNDTWSRAVERGKSMNTFHNYQGAYANGARIDWILTRSATAVVRAEILSFHQDGQFPSDHFPVLADVLLGPANQKD